MILFQQLLNTQSMKVENCSTSALHRGSRIECLQAAFSEVKPTQAQPSALPSPALSPPFTPHQRKGSPGPSCLSTPATSQMLVISRDQCEAGLASGSSLPVLLVAVCVSESACMQTRVCECKHVSRGCSNCSSGLLPEVKRLPCTLMLLAFCSPLPPAVL